LSSPNTKKTALSIPKRKDEDLANTNTKGLANVVVFVFGLDNVVAFALWA
jgi:hypothetical protein